MAGRGRGRGEAPMDPHYEWMHHVIETQQKMMNDMMWMQQQHMAQMQQMHQVPQPQPNVQVHAPPLEDPNRMYFRFQKMNPPIFKGESDPMKAHFWVDSMERIFITLQCGEEEKVICAANALDEDAHTWWTNTRAMMQIQGVPLTWNNFKVQFLNKFFPTAQRLRKQAEFTNLKQGDMSVGEYAAKFERLSQFYELGRYAPDDGWKMNMFKEGLRGDINQGLSSFTLTNYPALVQQAHSAEEDLKKLYAERKDF